jgi:hypothetical protein
LPIASPPGRQREDDGIDELQPVNKRPSGINHIDTVIEHYPPLYCLTADHSPGFRQRDAQHRVMIFDVASLIIQQHIVFVAKMKKQMGHRILRSAEAF